MSRLIRAGSSAAVSWRAPEVTGPPGQIRRTGDPDLDALQQRAWSQGFEQGRTAGLEAGFRECHGRLDAALRILDSLARPLEDLDHRVEEELLALVRVVCQQLLRREFKADAGHLVGVIREALAALPLASGDVVVRLHPSDADALRERLATTEGERAWRLESDPLLEPGGCLVTTARSTVDARLETRLSRVVAGLLEDERGEHGPEEPHG